MVIKSAKLPTWVQLALQKIWMILIIALQLQINHRVIGSVRSQRYITNRYHPHCSQWAAASMDLVYEFIANEVNAHGTPPFDIPQLQFVKVALATSLKIPSYLRRLLMTELMVPLSSILGMVVLNPSGL